MTATTVLITGASGFIALHTVQALVKKGYNVVGTVRNDEKGEYVKKASGNPSRFSYEIVDDISKIGAFDDFVKNHPEASVFLHTASPVLFHAEDIKRDLLDPAIQGTKTALQSIKKYGKNIRRVVVTSSYAAIFTPDLLDDPTVTFDETSWSYVTLEQALTNPLIGYLASKTFAEKAAWDFVEQEKPHFTLSAVHPTYVFGPQPTNDFDPKSLNTSARLFSSYLKLDNSNAHVEPIFGLEVDVRDVAKAHIAAFEKEEAQNERLLLAAGSFTQQTILDVLHKEFPKQTENLPVGTPGSDAAELATKAQNNYEKTRRILDFEFIPIEKTFVDTARQIYEVEGKI